MDIEGVQDGVGGIPVNTKWLFSHAEGILVMVLQQVRRIPASCFLPSATKFSKISENKVI